MATQTVDIVEIATQTTPRTFFPFDSTRPSSSEEPADVQSSSGQPEARTRRDPERALQHPALSGDSVMPSVHTDHALPSGPPRQPLTRSTTVPALVIRAASGAPACLPAPSAAGPVSALSQPAPVGPAALDARKKMREAGRIYTPRSACPPATSSPRVSASPRASQHPLPSSAPQLAPVSTAVSLDCFPTSVSEVQPQGQNASIPASLHSLGHAVVAVGAMRDATMQDARNLAMIFPQEAAESVGPDPGGSAAQMNGPESVGPDRGGSAAQMKTPASLHMLGQAAVAVGAMQNATMRDARNLAMIFSDVSGEPPSSTSEAAQNAVVIEPAATILTAAQPAPPAPLSEIAAPMTPPAPAAPIAEVFRPRPPEDLTITMELARGGEMPDGAHVDKLGKYVPLAEGRPNSADPLVNGRRCYARLEDARLMLWWASGRWWIGKRSELGQPRGWIKAASNGPAPPFKGWYVLCAKIKPAIWKSAETLSCVPSMDTIERQHQDVQVDA